MNDLYSGFMTFNFIAYRFGYSTVLCMYLFKLGKWRYLFVKVQSFRVCIFNFSARQLLKHPKKEWIK